MEYTEDFLNKVVQMGILGYDVAKVINVLDVEEQDEQQFTSDFANTESLVFKRYKKGVDKAEYALDAKLFDLAQKGNIAAMKKWEERQYMLKHNS